MNLIHSIYNVKQAAGNLWRLGYLICTLVISAVILSGCQMIDEDFDVCPEPEQPATEQELYLYLTVTLPEEAVTRSFTTEDGNASDNAPDGNDRLEGTSAENALYSATIYLVDNNDEIKLQLDTENIGQVPGNQWNRTLKAKIESLSTLAELQGQTLKVLIVANASETSLGHNFDQISSASKTNDAKEAYFSVNSLESDYPIGKFGTRGKTMPFVNADDEVTITIPSGSDVLAEIQKKFTPVGNGESIWNINDTSTAIDLERAIARLEYKDGDRTSGSNLNGYDKNIFPIPNVNGVTLQLYSIQPFNVNKNSYLFRHTADGSASSDGTGPFSATGQASLFGVEKGSADGKYNWVAGTDWTYTSGAYSKSADFLNALDLSNNKFEIKYENSVTSDGLLYIQDIEKASNGSQDGYHPFFYVTENTLPSTSMMNDEGLAAHATGVAFTFIVLATDNKPLTYVSNNFPAGITKPDETDKAEANVIRITDKDNNWIELKPVELKIPKTDPSGSEEDFDRIQGYTITYIGYIVHNDDKTNYGDATPPMHYGVVRNNTYQLSVKSINSLPFPNEPESYYLSLQIRVLAWAKRDITVSW